MNKNTKIALYTLLGLTVIGVPVLLSARNKQGNKQLPGGNNNTLPGGNPTTQPGWGTNPVNPENKSEGGIFSFFEDLYPNIFGNDTTNPLPGKGSNVAPPKPTPIKPTYPVNPNQKVVIVPPGETPPSGGYKFNPACFQTHPYVPISPMVAAVAVWESLSDVPEYIPHDCLIQV
jgi:hypothetical protein